MARVSLRPLRILSDLRVNLIDVAHFTQSSQSISQSAQSHPPFDGVQASAMRQITSVGAIFYVRLSYNKINLFLMVS